MKPLGIGTRVFIGWTDSADEGDKKARLKQGTIVRGPHKPGGRTMLNGEVDYNNNQRYTYWIVVCDGVSAEVAVAEYLLTPIDDDPESVERDSEQEVTA